MHRKHGNNTKQNILKQGTQYNGTRLKYIMSAVIKGQLIEDTRYAISDRQAWYYYCKANGFYNRDFKILYKGIA